MSIGTLRDGKAEYYLHAVARGAEDYYLGHGEAPGRWIGRLAGELGLEGRVAGKDLHQVLAGRDPLSGERLSRSRHRRVPGFDLTLCAPKSVSVLWGLSDWDTASAVRDAHDTAVRAAIGYLETEACWSRRGTNGVNQVRGDGFIAAAFRHRTSRAGDPHLHTHVLVANATRSDDGWGTLDARHLLLHGRTAGFLYQAQLRAELVQRLGVEWTAVRHGTAEVVGIPRPVLEAFATRRNEIEEEMALRGVGSARAAQYAALETRQAKDYDVEGTQLHTHWHERAAALGFGSARLDRLTVGTPPTTAAVDEAAIVARLLGPDGLTQHASTFDRRDIIRAWCEQLPHGAPIATIERLADRTLNDRAVVPLAPRAYEPTSTLRRRRTGKPIDTPSPGLRYSTRTLLNLETRFIRRATLNTETPIGVAGEAAVLDALAARPGLSSEQVEMVAALTTAGRALDVVIAPALRALGERLGPIRLTQNRRQHQAWERTALTQLRDGHIDDAVTAYHEHGRIHTSTTAIAARDTMVADWWAATLAGDHVVMLASHTFDVDDLNARARHHYHDAGQLTGPTLITGERPYQAGDRMMTLRNKRRLGVRNGTCATIEHIDEAARTMRLRTDTGTSLNLPADYIDAGHIRHAYSTTIHKAQGQTADRAFVLGSDMLYQEAGYVALSRGRIENHIYLVDTQPRPEAHAPEISAADALDTFKHVLTVSRAQHLATDTGIDRHAVRNDLDTLVRERDQLRELQRTCPPSRAHEIVALMNQRDNVSERLTDAKNNLAELDTQRGWRSRRNRNADRVVLTHETHDLTGRLTRFDEALERAHQEHRHHETFRRDHGHELDRLPGVERSIDARVEQLVDTDITDPPAYLRVLGAVPADDQALHRWRDAAEYIERHRADHNTIDTDRPLGRPPETGEDPLWQLDAMRLNELTAGIHKPVPTVDLGVDLGIDLW